MLVLTRKSEESVMVGNAIEIKVLNVRGDQVSLGFSAPREISIHRKEVYDAIQQENKAAVSRGGVDDVKRLFASLGRPLLKGAAQTAQG
ncbi:MAG: carbon storage regulator CsrA [Lentisphaerae bacterium]|nr:carbon storage regulator CsrA [Lentisphaerota bacterium]